VTWSLFGVARAMWVFFVFAAMCGGNGFMFPVVRTFLTRHFGREHYGNALGILAFLQSISQILAPVIKVRTSSSSSSSSSSSTGVQFMFTPAFVLLAHGNCARDKYVLLLFLLLLFVVVVVVVVRSDAFDCERANAPALFAVATAADVCSTLARRTALRGSQCL
jgi:nitrate/nitrite transporter NarK